MIFAVGLQWFPAIGAGESGNLGDRLAHLVLPSFAIGLSWVGYIARSGARLDAGGAWARASISAPPAPSAFPSGASSLVYALRIAILPVVTVIGVGMGFLLSAAVFTEIVFARPGLGKLVIDSITTRNYPIVMGSVLVSTGLFVLSTAIADLVNAHPRSARAGELMRSRP